MRAIWLMVRRSDVRRLLFLGAVFCTTVGWMLLQKPAFLLFYHARAAEASFGEWLGVLWHGLSLDCTVAGYVTAFPVLVVLASFWIPLSQRVWRIVLTVYFSLIALVTAAIFAVDLNLYGYWGFRLDGSVLIYLADPGEALASASWGEVLRQIFNHAGLCRGDDLELPVDFTAFPGRTRSPAGPDCPDGCGAADRRLDFSGDPGWRDGRHGECQQGLFQLEHVPEPTLRRTPFFRFSLRSGTMRTMPRLIRSSKRSGGRLFSKSCGATVPGPMPVRPDCCAATGRTSY